MSTKLHAMFWIVGVWTLLKTIRDSGWRGPVGILDHRPETDSEETLRANLAGLQRLRQQLADEAKK